MYIIDTREQKPLPLKPAIRKKLEVGDYTTKALENKFHIERKSLQDLYSTLTASNSRFKYELFKAAYYNIHLVVVVEGSYDDFINKRFPKGEERKFSSEGLAKLIKTFQTKYFLTFHFCNGRQAAKKLVEKLLSNPGLLAKKAKK
jgi:ERCC4-type nuclease